MTPGNTKTQRAQILRILVDAKGDWVPLPKIMACAAQYNARVLELRRLGFAIENRTEHVDGERHSWFRLVKSPPSVDRAPVQEAGESAFMRRRREEDEQAAPLFTGARP
jgi:hypothetical protein